MSIADHMAMQAGKMSGEKMPDMPKMESHEGGDAHEMVKAHLAKMHEMHGGKHMHIQGHEDGTHTTHHVGESGKVEGPHEHESTEAMKEHAGKCMDEEGGESGSSDNDDEGLM